MASVLAVSAYSVEKLDLCCAVKRSPRSGARVPFHAGRMVCCAGMSFASFLRFWAVAARWNSSRAPHGPRNRSRRRPRMRLRWANSISTFFRSLQEMAYCRVCEMARATSRAGSYIDLVTLRCGSFGQHFGFRPQAWQSAFRARYRNVPYAASPPHWLSCCTVRSWAFGWFCEHVGESRTCSL